jgi:hypothetical protein
MHVLGNWCDQVFIKAVSAMWLVGITVVCAKSLTEHRFDVNGNLREAHIVLVHNSSVVNGHYSAARELIRRITMPMCDSTMPIEIAITIPGCLLQ